MGNSILIFWKSDLKTSMMLSALLIPMLRSISLHPWIMNKHVHKKLVEDSLKKIQEREVFLMVLVLESIRKPTTPQGKPPTLLKRKNTILENIVSIEESEKPLRITGLEELSKLGCLWELKNDDSIIHCLQFKFYSV